jgi:thiosulfate dehydrogenase (quinone) large subunit
MSRFARSIYGPAATHTPRLVQLLFWDTRGSWLWLTARLYLGWQWLDSGWNKVTDDAWMSDGVALQRFWERSVDVPEEGRPAITYGWYRDFLQHMLDNEWYTWFAPLIAIGETLVGIALILGAFTAVAAFFGAFMNFNFMLAGTASTNPVLFIIAIFLILAWRTAGYLGLDRFLLPALGTPWQPGFIVGRRRGDGGGGDG